MRSSLVIIFVSLAALAPARAQNKWEPVRGVADIYPTQRAAVDAMVEELVADLRARPFDDFHGQILLRKLSPQESGVPAEPEGNVNVSGSWGTVDLSVQIGPNITTTASQ